jgi:hypothetical protein
MRRTAMKFRNRRYHLLPQARNLAFLLVFLMAVGLTIPALAASGEVTSGEFQTFAAGNGRGYEISGKAHMTRSADGKTIVSVHVKGLAPKTAYGVHVHNKACGDANGGGHYQEVVGGPVDAYNEIWPLITTNSAGIGNGKAIHAFRARPEAQSVVVHDTDGARLACADLD